MPAGHHRQWLVGRPAATLIPQVARTLAVRMIVREVNAEDRWPVECPVYHGGHASKARERRVDERSDQ